MRPAMAHAYLAPLALAFLAAYALRLACYACATGWLWRSGGEEARWGQPSGRAVSDHWLDRARLMVGWCLAVEGATEQ